MRYPVAAVVLALVAFGGFRAEAFAPPTPLSKSFTTTTTSTVWRVPHQPNIDVASTNLLVGSSLQRNTATRTGISPTALWATASGGIEWSSLAEYALQQVISAGIPAVFALVVVFFAAKAFNVGGKKENSDFWGDGESAVDDLYNDLYGDGNAQRGGMPKLSSLLGGGGKRSGGIPSRNLGVPTKKYLKIERLNERYDSYSYSLTSATRSKALAAATLREQNFDRALERAVDSSLSELTPAEKTDLLRAEKELLKVGGGIVSNMRAVQQDLTDRVIRDEMKRMDVDVGELDPEAGEYEGVDEEEGVIVDAVIDEENDAEEGNVDSANAAADDTSKNKADKKGRSRKVKSTPKANVKTLLKSANINKDIKTLEELNTELVKLELSFIRAVIEILGPERANGVRAAILGNEEGGVANAGALLKSLTDRPLSAILAGMGYTEGAVNGGRRKSLFVMDFPGDVSASQVANLREEVTAVVRSAEPGDEALLVLQSGGGTVTGYGLAASQLTRFREKGIKLTVAVEQVAASGGYMMCCVADRIVASPFAVLGSIGVISDTPNVYERLKKEGVEFQTVTAGKYKRTLTPTKKPTSEDIKKQKEELEGILVLFKQFVGQNRPTLDIDSVATGETWFGEDALEKGLCDEIRPVDDVLADYVDSGFDVYDVAYDPPPEDAAGLLAGLPIGALDRSFGASGRIKAGGSGSDGSPARALARWLARSVVPTVAEEIVDELRRTELGGMAKEDGVSKRFMMKDDSADRIRAQD
eukprot:CAMPEP_0113572956 /NCGR_PEP_ID=MMETSP0015_2-20120614/26363_1 /TAXON_ID=2838 /ORGANISM="Odontella" /LENGTH=758 /DNA_ID=CAMNT_0000476007 /DNA_START=103 /DNA_END=2379 /DNA_ORIENTATION=+ /assembly_acc=CAM_ASM_000160